MKMLNNILILGRGYVGKYLADALSKTYNVILVSRDDINYHNPTILSRSIYNNNIQYVINCSGFTGRPNVDEAEHKKELCWELNVLTPLQVASACNLTGARLIHISSGCIYNGYDKVFTEEDSPNFGLFDHSSFYSKSKHAFELMSRHLGVKILRLRMPICDNITSPRNYISKILKYPKLIDFQNSKTYLPDLCGFVQELISNQSISWRGQDIYNVVNTDPLTTKTVIDIISNLGVRSNPEWVDVSELDIVAPRSNCILDNTKASKLYTFKTEKEVLETIFTKTL